MHESHAIMSDPRFDHKKKTVLYIHGYVEAPSHQSIHVIVDAYLTRDDYNCLVLDWSVLADGNFFVDAVPNIKQVNQQSKTKQNKKSTLVKNLKLKCQSPYLFVDRPKNG